jgi:hypothetical protein
MGYKRFTLKPSHPPTMQKAGNKQAIQSQKGSVISRVKVS